MCVKVSRNLKKQFEYLNLDIVDDTYEFNKNLMRYFLWYNITKPHRSLDKKSQLKYYIDKNLINNHKKPNMLWTYTQTCMYLYFFV